MITIHRPAAVELVDGGAWSILRMAWGLRPKNATELKAG